MTDKSSTTAPGTEPRLHQPLPVQGYRAQSPESVQLVNSNKQTEEQLLRLLDSMRAAGPTVYDQRWLSIARTHLEQGFMALNRAVFQPGRVKLEGDAW